MPVICCIDGIIGAGKSSLLQRLAPRYSCFPEPVAEWTLLSPFYQNRALYALPFHLQILISQFRQRQAFPEKGIVLVERSPWTSRHVFAPLLLPQDQLDLYDAAYRQLSYPVDYFIYLDIEPTVAYQRHTSSSAIGLDYLHQLRDQYLQCFESQSNVFTIDAHLPPELVEQQALKRIASISPSV